MPRDALIVVPFAVVVVVAGGALLLGGGGGGKCRGYSFDRAEWRRGAAAGDGRERAARRLEDCLALAGERPGTVRGLLGRPDVERPGGWSYLVRTGPDGQRFLRVVFKGGRVSELHAPG